LPGGPGVTVESGRPFAGKFHVRRGYSSGLHRCLFVHKQSGSS
jgi:hypothetical protein